MSDTKPNTFESLPPDASPFGCHRTKQDHRLRFDLPHRALAAPFGSNWFTLRAEADAKHRGELGQANKARLNEAVRQTELSLQMMEHRMSLTEAVYILANLSPA